MWLRKTNVHNVASFSLVEVLLSLLLGSMVILTFSYFYTDILLNQTKQRELSHLQMRAQQLLTYMNKHIQHIGYRAIPKGNSNFSLFLKEEKYSYSLNHPQCLIFFYDLNQDGCLGKAKTNCTIGETNNTTELAKEIFGFKFEQNTIYAYRGNEFNKCTKEECQKLLLDCDKAWEKFIDNVDYKVTQLHFSWVITDKLLRVELELASVSQPEITYHSTMESYILNSGD